MGHEQNRLRRFRRRRRPDLAPGTAVAAQPPIDCATATALGDRRENQDRCAISGRWAVLSDGAGGHLGGALAAELSVRTVLDRLQAPGATVDSALLERAVQEANAKVRARRQEDRAVAHMAATLVIAAATAVSDDESSWLVASIGDSRAWIVTSEAARQITDDDNVAAELLRSGSLSPEDALTHPGRHWITRAIGPREAPAAQIAQAQLRPGDALLLASDGLDVLSAGRIHETTTAQTSAKEAADGLVALALRSGAIDNVTVAVLRHVPSSGDADRR